MIVVLELKQQVARLAEGQRLRRGARRGEGRKGHGGIVTPLGLSGNVNRARPAIRIGVRHNQGASPIQINALKRE